MLFETGKFLDRASVGLTAIATVLIGIFTWRLYLSTEKLWDAGERALQTTERAYVFLEGFDVEITTLLALKEPVISDVPERYHSRKHLYITRFAVLPKWKNGGNTPTRSMKISINWRGPSGPIPPDYIYPAKPTPFFLAPMATEVSDCIELPWARALVDWGLNPIGLEPMLFIWGRADYEDVFGNSHFTEWCRRIRLDCHDGQTLRATFIQWGAYNRTD